MQLWNWRGLDVINAHERDPKVYVQGMREAVDGRRLRPARPRPALHAQLPARAARRGARRHARPAGRVPQGAGDAPMTQSTAERRPKRRPPVRARLPGRGLDRPPPHGGHPGHGRGRGRSASPTRRRRTAAEAARLAPDAELVSTLDDLLDAGRRRRGDRHAERAACRAVDPGAGARRGGVLPEAARAHGGGGAGRGGRGARGGPAARGRPLLPLHGGHAPHPRAGPLRRARARLRGRPRLPQRLRAGQALVLRPGALGRRLRHGPRASTSSTSRCGRWTFPACPACPRNLFAGGEPLGASAPTGSRITRSPPWSSRRARRCGSPAPGACTPDATPSSPPPSTGRRAARASATWTAPSTTSPRSAIGAPRARRWPARRTTGAGGPRRTGRRALPPASASIRRRSGSSDVARVLDRIYGR